MMLAQSASKGMSCHATNLACPCALEALAMMRCINLRFALHDITRESVSAYIFTARSELRQVMFLALSVCGFFVCV